MDDYLSACNSLEAIDKWFDGFWEELFKAGFMLVEYELEDTTHCIQHTNTGQILFPESVGKLIGENDYIPQEIDAWI